MQLGLTMLFGLALVASLVVITLIWSRLAHHKVGAATAVSTLWIVFGPLGQLVTAAHNVGHTAPAVLPDPYVSGVGTMSAPSAARTSAASPKPTPA